MHLEFHIQNDVRLGKLKPLDIRVEKLPDWSTPAFVVDHTRKGLLGRMVCAFGPLNHALVPVSFPSADPEGAFQACAGKKYHATCDCIWGFTKLLLDEETSRKIGDLHQERSLSMASSSIRPHARSCDHPKLCSQQVPSFRRSRA